MTILSEGITIPDIQDRILQYQLIFINVYPNITVNPETPVGILIDNLATSAHTNDLDYLALFQSINPDVASGISLDGIANFDYIVRGQPTRTTVVCDVTGLAGTVIPVGSRVIDNNGLEFELQDEITIAVDGTGSGTFVAVQDGEIQVAANTVTRIVQQLTGWDTVDNSSPGVPGTGRETDSQLRARRELVKFKQPTGTALAFISAIIDIDGVEGAYVADPTASDPPTAIVIGATNVAIGEFALVVLGGTDDDIAQTIYDKKPLGQVMVGSTVLMYDPGVVGLPTYNFPIIRPTEVPLYIDIVIEQPGSQALPANTPQELADFIAENYNDIANRQQFPKVGLALEIYISQFLCFVKDFGITEGIPVTYGIQTTPLSPPPTYSTNPSVTINNDQAATLEAANVRVTINYT